jgi:ATPase subunit of ABC transporter with duplicated ATPase domains
LNLGGESGDKPVEAFSGGERRRIMLARLMAQRADCLFLDEPTNDLDIASREALEDVLASYDGALFVVSHDRYLLKRLGDRVVAIRDGKATIHNDGYDAYERKQHETQPDARGKSAPAKSAPAKAQPGAQPSAAQGGAANGKQSAHDAKQELFRRKREVTDAEKRVARLEEKRADLELSFAAPDLYDEPGAVVELQQALERIRTEIDDAMGAWERAVDAFEAFEAGTG